MWSSNLSQAAFHVPAELLATQGRSAAAWWTPQARLHPTGKIFVETENSLPLFHLSYPGSNHYGQLRKLPIP